MVPVVLHEVLVLQSFQKWVQCPAFDPREAMLTKDLGDGVAMAIAVTEHREHCLRKGCAGQLLVKINFTHK